MNGYSKKRVMVLVIVTTMIVFVFGKAVQEFMKVSWYKVGMMPVVSMLVISWFSCILLGQNYE